MAIHSDNTLKVVAASLVVTLAVVGLSQCDAGTPVSPLYEPGIFSAGPLWSFTTDKYIVSTPVTDGSLVFIRTTHEIIAVDPQTGEVVWRADSRARWTVTHPPILAGTIILAPELDGSVAAFSTDNGELLWRHCSKCAGSDSITSIVSSGDAVYVVRRDNQIASYDLQTGKILWQVSLRDRWSHRLGISGDTLYVTQIKGIRAYDRLTGDFLWEQDLQGRSPQCALLSNDVLYMVTVDLNRKDPEVVAFDLNSLTYQWTSHYPSNHDFLLDCLNLLDDTLYVGGGKDLLALSAEDGSVEWQFESKRDLQNPITASGKDVILIGDLNQLYALDGSTGSLIGSLALDMPLGNGVGDAEVTPLLFEDLAIVPVSHTMISTYLLSSTH